jgi:hypothetical protein
MSSENEEIKKETSTEETIEKKEKELPEEKISSLILSYGISMKFKKELLKQQILLYRNQCASKITALFKGFFSRIQFKKKLFFEVTKNNRINAVKQIKTLPKYIKYRGKILNILKKKKDYYFITSSVNDTKSLKLYPKEGEPIIYTFEKNDILDNKLVYIKKSEVGNTNQKIHFLNDKGNVIIDPKFETDFADNSFYNIINFKKLQKEEKEQKEDNEKLVKQYFIGRAKTVEMRSSASQEFLTFGSLKKKSISKYGNRFQSLSRLNSSESSKSILKGRPTRRVPSQRKISFGKIQFSY